MGATGLPARPTLSRPRLGECTAALVARLEDGTELFIPGRYLMGAMPGDKVLLHRQEGEGDLDEGRVKPLPAKTMRC